MWSRRLSSTVNEEKSSSPAGGGGGGGGGADEDGGGPSLQYLATAASQLASAIAELPLLKSVAPEDFLLQAPIMRWGFVDVSVSPWQRLMLFTRRMFRPLLLEEIGAAVAYERIIALINCDMFYKHGVDFVKDHQDIVSKALGHVLNTFLCQQRAKGIAQFVEMIPDFVRKPKEEVVDFELNESLVFAQLVSVDRRKWEKVFFMSSMERLHLFNRPVATAETLEEALRMAQSVDPAKMEMAFPEDDPPEFERKNYTFSFNNPKFASNYILTNINNVVAQSRFKGKFV